MSDREWYEGLTGEELEGKHVHAVYDYGTVVDGELCRNGSVRLDHRDEDGAPVFVIDDGHVVNTFAHILSVSLVWDERDWEQILTVDISKADAIVVNGRLIRVNGLYSTNQFRPVDVGVSVPFEHVSCALRRRSKLPTEPGTYRGADGKLLIRLDCPRERWMCVSVGSSVSGAYVDDEVAAKYLPLTPVRFVDGRAE